MYEKEGIIFAWLIMIFIKVISYLWGSSFLQLIRQESLLVAFLYSLCSTLIQMYNFFENWNNKKLNTKNFDNDKHLKKLSKLFSKYN